MVPVIVLRNKVNQDRFLAANMDVGDWDDENLDIKMDDIQNAYMIVRNDLQPVTQEDFENHKKMHADYKKAMIERYGDNAFISLDFEEVLKAYEPVKIEITQEQYEYAKSLWEE